MKDVGAGVVADGVELAAGPVSNGGVDFGVEDSFGLGERAGDDVAVGADDCGVAA